MSATRSMTCAALAPLERSPWPQPGGISSNPASKLTWWFETPDDLHKLFLPDEIG